MPDPRHPVTVEVDGRTLRLTSLDKVLYPATGTTKAEVITYLTQVSGPLLHQLHDRPLTRLRWPHGVSGSPSSRRTSPRAPPAGSAPSPSTRPARPAGTSAWSTRSWTTSPA
ncbi:hypothetical protein GCM10025862_31280 [Arsenicicoccus piscis]|uniref:DNA ligase D polymerase domain-containing protein n=1 Tax=Arsenicicoccus piscis TaxID=673954 RepID=A0ABQ6HSZ0_9MICO|nr:hypothetical protein GCM10025862_31280 [Arsenicicoccus piscis]